MSESRMVAIVGFMTLGGISFLAGMISLTVLNDPRAGWTSYGIGAVQIGISGLLAATAKRKR